MQSEVTITSTQFTTHLTHKVPHTTVGVLTRQTFPIPFACKSRLACMGEDVPGNGSLGGAHFPAVVTSVGPHTWGCLLLLVLAVPVPAGASIFHGNTAAAPAGAQSNKSAKWVKPASLKTRRAGVWKEAVGSLSMGVTLVSSPQCL